MEMSTEIGALAAALAKAQKTMKGAHKDSTNPHFKSKYADLASVWDAARDALTANGLSVVQGASADGANVTVTTLLLHESGQWVKDALTMLARDAGPQSVGSCITYGRRYGLAAASGIAPEDDDAEAATVRQGNESREFRSPAPAPVDAAAINAAVAEGFNKGTASRFSQPVKPVGKHSKYAPGGAKPEAPKPATGDIDADQIPF